MIRNASIACAALCAGVVAAHDGHGWSGTHLHASDLFGFTVLALAVGGLAWWRGRK
jgi:hypothetical protein